MARRWGDFWHVHGDQVAQRNAMLATRSAQDYAETDWLYAYAREGLKNLETRS